MSKLGVGVGNEFPIDEATTGESAPNGCGNWQRSRDEWRDHRNQWREERRQWREERRQRERELYEPADAHAHVRRQGYRRRERQGLLRIAAIVGLVVMTLLIFNHIYFFFGLVVLIGLYFAYRGGSLDIQFPAADAAPSGRPEAQTDSRPN